MNQLPDARRWVLGRGNADSYVGLRINFVPHHSPILALFDKDGGEREQIDLAPLSFEELTELMESNGFSRKRLL